MIGKVFGRLTVIAEAERLKKYERRFVCRCACGGEKTVTRQNLVGGGTSSCGCLKREMLLQRNAKLATHGMSKTSEYLAWINIHRRCGDPKDKAYGRYGAVGIRVCKRWRTFENFISDMGMKPTPEHQIERRKNSQGYSPGNCYWATTKAQSRNKSSNVEVVYGGESMVLRDACSRAGLNYWTVWSRIDKGWPPKRWFEPTNRKNNPTPPGRRAGLQPERKT
jgi:hypothetical protein